MPRAKKVYNQDTGAVYSSISAAASEFNISYDDIVKCIKDGIKVQGCTLLYESARAVSEPKDADTDEASSPISEDSTSESIQQTLESDSEPDTVAEEKPETESEVPEIVEHVEVTHKVDYTLHSGKSMGLEELRNFADTWNARGIDCYAQPGYILFFDVVSYQAAQELDKIRKEYGYQGGYRYTSMDKRRYVEVMK